AHAAGDQPQAGRADRSHREDVAVADAQHVCAPAHDRERAPVEQEHPRAPLERCARAFDEHARSVARLQFQYPDRHLSRHTRSLRSCRRFTTGIYSTQPGRSSAFAAPGARPTVRTQTSTLRYLRPFYVAVTPICGALGSDVLICAPLDARRNAIAL